jgi:hypothetical protein
MNDLTRYRLCAWMKTTSSAKLLYCYLLDVTDDRNSINISVKSIAKTVGLSRSAVGCNMHRLQRLNMLSILLQYSEDGGRLSNKYALK